MEETRLVHGEWGFKKKFKTRMLDGNRNITKVEVEEIVIDAVI